ncbi:MAG: nucleotidyltransferase domain-containing protein [Candidatus Cloacimonetes bacterium]|nr:nucleotidyltransferase domain-containing protein [Candidatus Cloacimonadota bacterium]
MQNNNRDEVLKTMPLIERVVDLIVAEISPDMIILFGSYARGDYTKNSDIDLLVLKKGITNERETTTMLYRTIYKEDIYIPIDIISMSLEKYFRLNDTIGYIYKEIHREGKIVYEAS